LTRSANGRGLTALSAQSEERWLAPLNLREFEGACTVLEEARITLTNGAAFSDDYRSPWILRNIYDRVTRNPRYMTGTSGVVLEPGLGLALIDEAHEAFAGQAELLRGHRVPARDLLADEDPHTGELVLEQSNGFIIRQGALSPNRVRVYRTCEQRVRRVGIARSEYLGRPPRDVRRAATTEKEPHRLPRSSNHRVFSGFHCTPANS
jgi:hypothetical protein